jgi:hypothetical protein
MPSRVLSLALAASLLIIGLFLLRTTGFYAPSYGTTIDFGRRHVLVGVIFLTLGIGVLAIEFRTPRR